MAASAFDDVPESASVFQRAGQLMRRQVLELKREKLLQHQLAALNKLDQSILKIKAKKKFVFQLPTGTGKSVLILLTPYFFEAQRVLVVTPSGLISSQLALDFNGETGSNTPPKLVQLEIVPQMKNSPKNPLPRAIKINRTVDLESYTSLPDVVIANAHKFGENRRVAIGDLDPKLFDLVIVDEAHHYPAPTWQKICSHFASAIKVFVTATRALGRDPKKVLWADQPYYSLSLKKAQDEKLIRRPEFIEVDGESELDSVFHAMNTQLAAGDEVLRQREGHLPDRKYQCQGMILAQGVASDSESHWSKIEKRYAELYGKGVCRPYLSSSSSSILFDFLAGKFRIVVVIGRMLEGFDHPRVLVLGIIRNVSRNSRVLFTQFVGRAVRLLRPTEVDNPLQAKVIAHESRHQKDNFEHFLAPSISENPEDSEDSEDSEESESEDEIAKDDF